MHCSSCYANRKIGGVSTSQTPQRTSPATNTLVSELQRLTAARLAEFWMLPSAMVVRGWDNMVKEAEPGLQCIRGVSNMHIPEKRWIGCRRSWKIVFTW